MATFKYFENDQLNFELEEKDFVTILGKGNKCIINNLYYLDKNDYVRINYMSFKNFDKKRIAYRINFVLNSNIDLFLCSKVKDEFMFVLENKGLSPTKITELISMYSFKFKIREILDCNPSTIGITNQIKVKLILALMTEPKVLVLENILEELDYKDRNFVIRILRKYAKNGNIIMNFTNNIEESLLGNKVLLTDEKSIIAEGKTLSVLNEEKLLKRLGFGEPFIIELCKLLMDYDLINKYYVSHKKLVNVIWK